MKQYRELLYRILTDGVDRPDRTGVGTRSIFGHTMRFNMADGFPLLTTKKLPFKTGPIAELLWMLEGSGNVADLHKYGAHFWDKWAKEDGDLGRVYGVQWRTFRKYWFERTSGLEVVVRGHVDQIAEAVRLLKEDPYSRRNLVVAWNPAELDEMVLPPCPYAHQLYVAEGKLSMLMNWRSVDVGIGMPFDIAVYAALLHMYAKVAGLVPHELICVAADCHIYLNHLEALQEQLSRKPYHLPQLVLAPQPVTQPEHDSLFGWTPDDFQLVGYNAHPHIKMEANL